MYTRRTVRKWQVIAAEVSTERNQERFNELLKELSEALNAEEERKLKADDLPKIPKRIMPFPAKTAPIR